MTQVNTHKTNQQPQKCDINLVHRSIRSNCLVESENHEIEVTKGKSTPFTEFVFIDVYPKEPTSGAVDEITNALKYMGVFKHIPKK